MQILGNTFYVYNGGEFTRMIGDRIRALEEQLAAYLVQITENEAVLDKVDLTPTAREHAGNSVKEWRNAVAEILVRIDAIRTLNNEFDVPKDEH